MLRRIGIRVALPWKPFHECIQVGQAQVPRINEVPNVCLGIDQVIVSAGSNIASQLASHEQRTLGEGGAEPKVGRPRTNHTEWVDLGTFVEDVIGGGQRDVYRRAREGFDRLIIVRAMQQADGNQHRAAEILGISRATLRTKLRGMRMETKKIVAIQMPESTHGTAACVSACEREDLD